ncbi:MAG: sugar phosphate isomerase/epimerase family protein [Verrucomicrobiota bacterium]|nr:sugar phosphate isomerase/epimerase family protein [Verrucomicrobiota bacterium]
MKICLTPGSIGVSANQSETIELAHRHGYDAVEPFGTQLAQLNEEQLRELFHSLKSRNLVWGAAGLTADFRGEEAKFQAGLSELPKISKALQKAGVTRVGTWIMPCHHELTYLENFKQHVRRLRAAAAILKDQGQRLGLEYIGTQTLRNSRKYPFIHTMQETRELIAEIGTGNVGFVLDTWHWWTAGDTAAQIHSFKSEDVISVDLNDAPAGIPIEQQMDGQRELPSATGVIPAKEFLEALVRIGYTGPIRPEPFNKILNDMDNETACATAVSAMKKGLALIGS